MLLLVYIIIIQIPVKFYSTYILLCYLFNFAYLLGS